MAIKQRETPLDGILLKVVFPILFSSGLGRQLLRWQIWHQDASSHSEQLEGPEPANVADLVARLPVSRLTRPLAGPTLRQKRAA